MIDNLEPLRIPGFRVLETGETGETHAILEDQNLKTVFKSNLFSYSLSLK